MKSLKKYDLIAIPFLNISLVKYADQLGFSMSEFELAEWILKLLVLLATLVFTVARTYQIIKKKKISDE